MSTSFEKFALWTPEARWAAAHLNAERTKLYNVAGASIETATDVGVKGHGRGFLLIILYTSIEKVHDIVYWSGSGRGVAIYS